MRVRSLVLTLLVALPGALAGQAAPRFAELTTSRLLVTPAQDVAGAPAAREWLDRFDRVFSEVLRDGGVGNGWAYAADAVRFQRQNPSYLADARALGARPLASDAAREGMTIPEPIASRLRAYVALAGARLAVVPAGARLDTTASPKTARLKLVIVDGRTTRVIATADVSTPFVGDAGIAADSLARSAARLFVKPSP